MESQDPEEPLNTETEEETIALRKKRLRRVSFADREITSVHIFNRDEDYETPPESSAAKPSSEEEVEKEVLKFFGDLASDSDGELKEVSLNEDDGDDADEIAAGEFLRPIGSPSPGSSTIGSGASRDENNFFGPVSASFIKPRRLYDSAASDDNNDITMDSTAFSLHFRSLARSESADLKTPTGVRMGFEEKTPSEASPLDPGSFMEFTKPKKPIIQSSPLLGKVTGGRDSNDMSLVEDNPHRYDYGRLPASLEALLAGDGGNMHSAPDFKAAFQQTSDRNEASVCTENGSGNMDMENNKEACKHDVSPDNVHIGASATAVHLKLGEVNGSSTTTLIDQVSQQSNANDKLTFDAPVGYCIQTPSRLNKINEDFVKVISVMSKSNAKFSTVSSGNLLDARVQLNSVRQLHLSSQGKHADNVSTEDFLIESNLNDGEHDSIIDKLPDKLGYPLSDCMTLLSVEQEQNFFDTANSSRRSSYVTPSPKQPGSSFGKRVMELGEILSSIRKSNSKFKIDSSPRISALKDGIEKSKRRLQEFLSSGTSPLNNVNKGLQRQNLDTRIRNLETHLFSADMTNEDHRNTINVSSTGGGKPMDFDSLNQNELTQDLEKHGESLQCLSSCADKVAEVITAAASPSQSSRLTKKVTQHPFTSDSLKEASIVCRSDSSLVEITFDQSKDHMYHKVLSPAAVQLYQSLSSSAEYQTKLSSDYKQQSPCKEHVTVGSGEDGNSIEHTTTTSDSHLTGVSEKLNSFLGEQLNSVLKNDHVKAFTQSKRMDGRKLYPPDLQDVTDIISDSQTPLKDLKSLNFKLQGPEINLQITNDPTMNKEKLPERGIKESSYVLASPNVQRRSMNESSPLQSIKELRIQSPLKELTGSPCTKDLSNLSFRDHVHPTVRKNGHGGGAYVKDVHYVQSPQDFESFSGQKRRGGDIFLEDADDAYKGSQIQRSPKFHKSGGNELELKMENPLGCDMGNEKIGGERALKKWTDISQKFSTETSQILSPLVDELNIRGIELLEDILIHLLRVNKYEAFYSEIRPQKLYNWSRDITHQSVAGRLLLYKIVYEKAKLQLMQVKHGLLLKRGQSLDSEIQKFEILKLNYARHLYTPGDGITEIDYTHHYSSTVNFEGKKKVASEKLTAMRQEVEISDGKIINLIKSFHISYKRKGEPGCADTIALLNDHLKKKMRCWSLRQHLQLWNIKHLERRNGRHNLVINYCDIICQRFTIVADVVSNIVISNELNDRNITKKFPNTDAYVAFAFVFNGEYIKKSVGVQSLAQETQMTSSLLRNLLAVVEEVQQARIELRNLMETRFDSPSAEHLLLQLSFIDFKGGRKVTVALDLTPLKHGIYPSEILPCQLQAPGTSLSSEIKAAAENLSNGYLRIIRLCRCISELVQTSNR